MTTCSLGIYRDFYDVYDVMSLNFNTYVSCDVCRLIAFVAYDVCPLLCLSHMPFVSYLVLRCVAYVAMPFLIFEFEGRGRRLNYFSSPFQDDCPKRWEFLQENVESSAGVGSPERAL